MQIANNENTEAAIAFGKGIATVLGNLMRYRLKYGPSVIPGGTDDVEMCLVTETGSRFRIEITYAGNDWEKHP